MFEIVTKIFDFLPKFDNIMCEILLKLILGPCVSIFLGYESKFWASRGQFCALKCQFWAFESQSLLASWGRFSDPWASTFGRWELSRSRIGLGTLEVVIRSQGIDFDLWALRVDFLLIKSTLGLCYPISDSWECNVIQIWRILVHGVYIPQTIGF